MRIFLKLKHWHYCILFLLFNFLPGFILGMLNNLGIIDYSLSQGYQIVYSSLISSVGYTYLYAIFFQLYKYKTSDLSVNQNYFNLYFFLYIGAGLGTLISALLFFPHNYSAFSYSISALTLQLSSPFYIMAFVCNIYICYQLAKLVIGVEIKEEPRFKQVFFIFLGFIFMPIGIWFIQPKLNRLQKMIDLEESNN